MSWNVSLNTVIYMKELQCLTWKPCQITLKLVYYDSKAQTCILRLWVTLLAFACCFLFFFVHGSAWVKPCKRDSPASSGAGWTFHSINKSPWNWANHGKSPTSSFDWGIKSYRSLCVFEYVTAVAQKQTACHTERPRWDPSSEPLSFFVARPAYVRRWKFRLKCTQLRKALRPLLSQITKLIWLDSTEMFASITWLCTAAFEESVFKYFNTREHKFISNCLHCRDLHSYKSSHQSKCSFLLYLLRY